MSLQILQADTDLWVDIPSSISIKGTPYKRKILITTMIYNTGTKNVITEGTVYFFDKNEDDTYGEKSTESHIIKSYQIKLVADNTSVCDVKTGVFICNANEIGNENDPASPVFERDYAYQFDWFFYIAQTNNINVHDLLRQFYLYHWSVGKAD